MCFVRFQARDGVKKACAQLMKTATKKLDDALVKATKLVGNKEKGIWQCSSDHAVTDLTTSMAVAKVSLLKDGYAPKVCNMIPELEQDSG
eukprot:6460846-Amphidinium_carterae.2